MFLRETIVGERARKIAVDGPFFGPAWPEEIAARVARIEVHSTHVYEDDADYSEFRGFDADGNEIAPRVRVVGY